jgi:integrase
MHVWLKLQYVQQKPSGQFFYRRRIPDNVQKHYQGKTHFQKSLKTKDVQIAKDSSERLSESLDILWMYFTNPESVSLPQNQRQTATALLKEQHGLEPAEGQKIVGHYSDGAPITAIEALIDLTESKINPVRYGKKPQTEETVILEEALKQLVHGKSWHWDNALDLHHRLNGQGKSKVDLNHVERPIRRLVTILGDKPLSEYNREDANTFRDWLYDATDKNLKKSPLTTSSVKRSMDSVNAVFNLANIEETLGLENPFSNLRYRKQEAKERPPVPIEFIRSIQGLCKAKDDDMRWLIALISDTGMRLGEAAGLEVSHVHLNEDIPYLTIIETDRRRLKTRTSRRRIPLVGVALWGAGRAVAASEAAETPILFPRYNKKASTNSNSASNGLNKWLKEHIPPQFVIHGFRHAMRDRLREVDCPADVMDEIGGWSKASIGQTYGKGSSLERLHRFMSLIVL